RRYLYLKPEAELQEMRYDLLVMDEGQDVVSPAYLKALSTLLKGGLEQGRWILFYDENQNIYNSEYREGMELLSKCSVTKFKLSTNCRNTIQIGEYCSKASGIKLNAFLKEDGEQVREVQYRGDADFKDKLTDILKRLERGGVRSSDITLLSAKRYPNSILARTGFEVSETGAPDDSGKPVFSTIQSFKGLDSKVVILCGLDDIPEENYSKFIYIAATRARTLLYVLCSGSVAES
ncbi:hypothetical protein J6253_02125, partial [bacterium]|nr:hypothetical protein [bacterium]